jgi:hypothetical protein
MHEYQDPGVLRPEVDLVSSETAVCLVGLKQEERNRQHIKSDHLLPNLKGRTISGGVVTMTIVPELKKCR